MQLLDHSELSEQIARILEGLAELRAIVLDQRAVHEAYTTAEVAKILGEAEFTVREWCRLGRMREQARQRPGQAPGLVDPARGAASIPA